MKLQFNIPKKNNKGGNVYNIFNTGGNRLVGINDIDDSVVIEKYGRIQKDPTGFDRRNPDSMGILEFCETASSGEYLRIDENGNFSRITGVTTFGDGITSLTDRTFIIRPKNEYFYYYFYGKKIYVKNTLQIQIDDISKTNFIVINSNGELSISTSAEDAILDNVLTGIITWNATDQKAVVFGDERHGKEMSSIEHLSRHETLGALYGNGLDWEGITDGGSTYTDTTSGVIWDEDLMNVIDNQNYHPFWYKSGTNGEWKTTTLDNNIGYKNGGSYTVWNEFDGTEWKLTEADYSTDYIVYFVVATNNREYPVVKIIGQGAYSSRGAARDAIETEINRLIIEGLPTPEFVFLYAYIVRKNGNLENWDDNNLVFDMRVGIKGGGAMGQAATQAQDISTDTTNFDNALTSDDTDVQKALETLDNKKVYAIVDASGKGDYTTITDSVADGKTNIFVRNGTYNEGNITITLNETNILGESKEGVKIVVPNGQDGIKLYTNNAVIRNITIDCETNNAEAGLVVGDGQVSGSPDLNIGNGNTIENVIVKGGDHTFAIYIAGPSYATGSDTLTGFENNGLSKGNRVINCQFYSPWNGDAFSFALQRDGEFRNNYCEGRIAFYMCRDSSCDGNIINNSAGHGIFVGGPVYNSSISYNVITNTTEAGIKLQNQLEHTPLLTGQAIRGNTIVGNTFNNIGGIGIEISGETDHEVQFNNISNNTIEGTGDHGIYLNNAYKNKLQNNIIKDVKQSSTSDRGSGIYMVVGVTDNLIQDNYIYSIDMHTGIANREDSECPRNIIRGNTILGTNTERTIWTQSSDWIIENNRIEGGYYAGIRVLDGSNTIIRNNKLYNNTRQASNAYYEIWIEGTLSNTLIEGNYIEGGTSTPLAGIGITADTVSDTKIYNNYGPLGDSIYDSGTNTYWERKGIILQSPGGSNYMLSVDDTGAVITTAI